MDHWSKNPVRSVFVETWENNFSPIAIFFQDATQKNSLNHVKQ